MQAWRSTYVVVELDVGMLHCREDVDKLVVIVS